jgi:nucleotide-binding universal stress UspA family protein
MYKKILAANDGSPNAFRALDAATDLASKYGAELHAVLVEEIEPRSGMIEEINQRKRLEDRLLRRHLKQIEAAAARHGVKVVTHAFVGHAVRTIVAFAKDNGFDLLVIGATGHSALHEALLGSRAERIVRLAQCPVLVVK